MQKKTSLFILHMMIYILLLIFYTMINYYYFYCWIKSNWQFGILKHLKISISIYTNKFN